MPKAAWIARIACLPFEPRRDVHGAAQREPFALLTTSKMLVRCASSNRLSIGERKAAMERAEEAITVSREQGLPVYLAFGLLLGAWALCRVADAEGARRTIGEMRQAMAQAQGTGSFLAIPSALGVVAETLREVGRLEEALGSVDVGLARSAEGNVPFWDAELHRLKGEIRLAQRFLQLPSRPSQTSMPT